VGLKYLLKEAKIKKSKPGIRFVVCPGKDAFSAAPAKVGAAAFIFFLRKASSEIISLSYIITFIRYVIGYLNCIGKAFIFLD
jgi:hypothetical protein